MPSTDRPGCRAVLGRPVLAAPGQCGSLRDSFTMVRAAA
ncbi:hypothetical protein SSCG_00351 [Streptomyces clavuligerus]|nr:hypothetical protein SSCG_00351 [Streptomyces clavuligerus]